MDKVKGRLKQAAASVAGDEQLKRQGERDEAAGKVKQKVDSINDRVDDAMMTLRRDSTPEFPDD